tara:strand:- start:6361 stop:6558 length:198 start_codon:yes stop_codon:yes gene_type:complete
MKNSLPLVIIGLMVGGIVGFLGSQAMKEKELGLIQSIDDRYEKVLLLVSLVAVLLIVLGVVILGK